MKTHKRNQETIECYRRKETKATKIKPESVLFWLCYFMFMEWLMTANFRLCQNKVG